MAKAKTPTVIKNEVRESFMTNLIETLTANNFTIKQIGDNEIAVLCRHPEISDDIYVTLSPTAKDYCDRTTRTKTIKAFDCAKAEKEYLDKCEARDLEKIENERKKEIKIIKDKKRREKKGV